MTGRLRRSISQALNSLYASLAAGATGPASVQEQPGLDGARELQMRKEEIELRFESRFAELFERRAAAQLERDAAGTRQGALPVDDRISNACRPALLDLDRRFGVLLSDPQLALHENPLTPDMVFRAFGTVCSDMDSGEPLRRAMLDAFTEQMVAELPQVYRDINNLLARRGVLLEGSRVATRREPFVAGGIGEGHTCITGMEVADSVRAIVGCRIEEHLGGRRPPRFIEEFLRIQWQRVLEQIYRDQGEQSVEWSKAIGALSDLLKHVSSFNSREDRRNAIWMLPGLLYRLKRGMRAAGIPLDEQLLFLKTLRAYHLSMLGQRAEAGVLTPAPATDRSK